jgi:cell division protein FtsQ
MWFDNRNVLHVEVYEREPIARIFTTAGNTFYIDSTEKKLPLSDRLSARVPVFTGFIDKKVYSAKDSLLLTDIKNIATYISNDPFWMSQVAQIDITPERNFELSPVVGNHLIKLGNGKDFEKKFSRLMVFYKQVLAQKGFDAYTTIDVQYAGQVVGTRRGTEKNK